MKRALCAISFALLIASSSQAGYDGQISLATGSGAVGSLGVVGSGSGSQLVGTNLSAPIATALAGGLAGTSTPLNGYFDFNTGAYTGTNASGDQLYGPGGNFFILTGTLPQAAGTAPLASDISTDSATVKALGITTNSGAAEYLLTMGFSSAYLSQTVASDFGLTYYPLETGRIYSGTLSFIFVQDSSLAGNQLLSGSITFNAPLSSQTPAPEPSSLVLMAIGGAGLLVRHGRRFIRRAS